MATPGGGLRRPTATVEPSAVMARWSLALAILPTGVGNLGALALAFVVLDRARRGVARGKGLAIAAVVLSLGWLLVLMGLVVIGIVADSSDESSFLHPDDRRPGQCFTDPFPDPTPRSVERVPCDEPHRTETYAVVALPDGDFPGDDTAAVLGQRGCFAAFADYVGEPFADSVFDFTYSVPTVKTWARGDRTAICTLYQGESWDVRARDVGSRPAPQDERRRVPIDKVRAGNCSDELAEDSGGDESHLTTLIPCADPHTDELYATFDLVPADFPGGAYPGDDEMDRLADEGCTPRFESFVGMPYDHSVLYLFWITPSESTWPDAPRIMCILQAPEPVTGSLQGSAR